MYRPPDSSLYVPKDFSNLITNQLLFATKSNNEVIILGDLNINYLQPENHFSIKALMMQWGFEQIIKQATRVTTATSTLIDIVLTNRQMNISSTHVIPSKSLVINPRLRCTVPWDAAGWRRQRWQLTARLHDCTHKERQMHAAKLDENIIEIVNSCTS